MTQPDASADQTGPGVYVVTGAASGIGLATTIQLASACHSVLAVDRDRSGLDEVVMAAKELGGGEVSASETDLSEPAAGDEVLRSCLERFSRCDGVVFSAGTVAGGTLADMTDAAYARCLDDNLGIHFRLTRAILQMARNRTLGVDQSSLVYIVSKHAVAPSTGFGAYPIAKAAELQLAKLAALEGAAFGVRANVVNPGAIVTGSRFWTTDVLAEHAAKHRVAPSRLEEYYARRSLMGVRVTIGDVAQMVAFLLSDRARATTGCVVPVDGGLVETMGR